MPSIHPLAPSVRYIGFRLARAAYACPRMFWCQLRRGVMHNNARHEQAGKHASIQMQVIFRLFEGGTLLSRRRRMLHPDEI